MGKKTKAEYISSKIEKLRNEGYKGKQAIAIAYSYARKKGYAVAPAKKSGNGIRYVRGS